MSGIVTIGLPFFGLILLGYGIGRWRKIPAEGIAALNVFVFYVALPVLFFRLVAGTPFGAMAHWSFVVTTTFSTYCAFAIAFSFGALVNRGNIPEATIEGLIGSNANIAYLAPGLLLAAFGARAGAPMALVFAFDTAMLAVLVPLMMTLGGTDRMKGSEMTRTIVRNVFRHPLVIATLAGLVVSFVGVGTPEPIAGMLDFIGSAAAPAALFMVGITLALRPIDRVQADLPVLIAIKLIVHPLIVYLLLSWIGGFDRVWVNAAILMAALPPAAGVLIFARQYHASVARASAAIVIGTAASLVTLTVALVLLLNDLLPIDPFR